MVCLIYPWYVTWKFFWYSKCHTETCWLFLFLTNGTIFANALLIISMDSISWLFWIFSAKTLHSLWVWSQVLSTVEIFQERIKMNIKTNICNMTIMVVEFQMNVSKSNAIFYYLMYENVKSTFLKLILLPYKSVCYWEENML